MTCDFLCGEGEAEDPGDFGDSDDESPEVDLIVDATNGLLAVDLNEEDDSAEPPSTPENAV